MSRLLQIIWRECKIELNEYGVLSIDYQVSSIKYGVSSIEFLESSIEYRALSIEYQVSSIEYLKLSIEYWVSSIEYQVSTEYQVTSKEDGLLSCVICIKIWVSIGNTAFIRKENT